jgi:hypothetical protein
VCEQFNENKDDNNTKCHFANDHYVPRADVVPKSEYDEKVIEYAILDQECGKFKAENEKLKGDLVVWKQDRFNLYQRLELYEITRQKVAREIFEEIENNAFVYGVNFVISKETLAELKKKYTEEKHEN